MEGKLLAALATTATVLAVIYLARMFPQTRKIVDAALASPLP